MQMNVQTGEILREFRGHTALSASYSPFLIYTSVGGVDKRYDGNSNSNSNSNNKAPYVYMLDIDISQVSIILIFKCILHLWIDCPWHIQRHSVLYFLIVCCSVLASGSEDCKAVIWNRNSGMHLATLTGHTNVVHTCSKVVILCVWTCSGECSGVASAFAECSCDGQWWPFDSSLGIMQAKPSPCV